MQPGGRSGYRSRGLRVNGLISLLIALLRRALYVRGKGHYTDLLEYISEIGPVYAELNKPYPLALAADNAGKLAVDEYKFHADFYLCRCIYQAFVEPVAHLLDKRDQIGRAHVSTPVTVKSRIP